MIAFDRYGHTSLGSCLKTKRTSAGSQRWLWPMTSWRRGTAVWIKVLGIAFATTWRRWIWFHWFWFNSIEFNINESVTVKNEIWSDVSNVSDVSEVCSVMVCRLCRPQKYLIKSNLFSQSGATTPCWSVASRWSSLSRGWGLRYGNSDVPISMCDPECGHSFFGKVRLLMMRKLINAQIECNFARAASQRQLLPQFLESAWIPESKFKIEWIQYWQWVTASLKAWKILNHVP